MFELLAKAKRFERSNKELKGSDPLTSLITGVRVKLTKRDGVCNPVPHVFPMFELLAKAKRFERSNKELKGSDPLTSKGVRPLNLLTS